MQSACGWEGTSPELLQAVVEQAPDAVIYADRDGIVRIWNDAAQALFGFAAAEVLGRSLDMIIPERFQSAHWAGFHKALESGRSKYGGRVMTTRAVHKTGNALYVDLSFALVKDRTGVVMGALAIGRDGTERHRSRSGAPGA